MIDVHSHFMLPCYPEGLERQQTDPEKEDGFPTLSWPAELNLAYMDQAGISRSIWSLFTPHIHHGDGALAAQLARRINTEAAVLCQRRTFRQNNGENWLKIVQQSYIPVWFSP